MDRGNLVLFSAGGLGIWSAMQWKGRLRMLETLRQMIYFLKGEITYSRRRWRKPWSGNGSRTSGDCLRPRQREFICRRESPFRRYGNAR